LTEINPDTGKVVKTFAATGEPTDLAAGDGALWVASSPVVNGVTENGAGDAAVSRVDPVSNAVGKTVRLPGTPELELGQTLGVSGLTVGAGAVWAVDPDGSISRIAPTTGSIAGHVATTGASAIASGSAGIWFLESAPDGPKVARIDPHTNRVGQVIPV